MKKKLFYTCVVLFFIITFLGVFKKANASTKKKIVVWTFWNEEWLQPGFDVFKKYYPEFDIEYQQLSWSNGKDKIITAIAGGNAPDIIELGSTWMSEFMEYNALSPIFLDKNLKDEYIGGFETAQKNGFIYGIPIFGAVNVITYNKKLFKKAGLTHTPTTLSELLEYSKKVSELGKNIYGYSLKVSGQITTWQKFLPFLWTFKGGILNEKNQLIFNSENTENALLFYKKLSEFSFVGTQDAVRQAFYLGKLGMIYDGPGLNLKENAPGIEYGTFALPGITPQEKGIAFAGLDYLCISKTTKYKNEAINLLLNLTKGNLISKHIKTLLSFNKNDLKKHLEDNKEFLFSFFKGCLFIKDYDIRLVENKDLSVYSEQIKFSRSTPITSKWESLMESLNFAIESVLLKNADINQSIKLAETKMKKTLSENKSKGKRINVSFFIFFIIAAAISFLIYLIIKIRKKNTLIFLSPWFMSFVFLSLYPVLFSFFISFTNYNPLLTHQTEFIFLDNYIRIINDAKFWRAAKNTFFFAFWSVSCTTIISIIVAELINQKIRFKKLFRASYFFPVITSIIVISMIFTFIYSPFGPINAILEYFNVQKINFLNDPDYALISVIIMTIWASFGYYMLLFLAALQSIPEELYESASIDGANFFKKFFYITLPMLKNMILFVVIINTIRSLQVFSEIFVMTGGGPLESTNTMVYYLYNYGFSKYQMGYSSATAYILFIIIFILSLIQLKIFGYNKEEI